MPSDRIRQEVEQWCDACWNHADELSDTAIDDLVRRLTAAWEEERLLLQRQIDAVDDALPEWKYTGRGRIETIQRLRQELAAAHAQVAALVEVGKALPHSGGAQGLEHEYDDPDIRDCVFCHALERGGGT